MDYAVRHFMPGRVRLYVPSLCRKQTLAQSFAAWLGAQPGIRHVRINYACASLIIEYDHRYHGFFETMLRRLQATSLDELGAILSNLKPAASCPPEPAAASNAPPAVSRRAPLALPTLSLLMALSRNPLIVAANMPLIAWNALPIVLRAWGVFHRERRLNVDFLDTLAIAASLVQGDPFAGSIITWLIKLGDWIRDLTAAGARRAVTELLEFQSKTAWVLRRGEIVSIPGSELKAGDLVAVYPGEMIPVDGEIIDGAATIDQKTITGEGLPVERSKGEAAFAGTVLRDGQLMIRALRVGPATTAAKIAELVESAPIGDTRMQNHAERFADRLVLPTLALAIGSTTVTADFNRFLSLVIIDYGTGIRVAAPTSVLSSMTHAARAGIIIKSGAHMERLAEADTVVFDKTGTLTHGAPAITDVIAYQKHLTPGHLVGLAAAAETRLKHPVAEALRSKAYELGVNIPPSDEITYRVGLGVEGKVNGYYLHVGNERFLRESHIPIAESARDRAALDERGYSCLHIAVDGVLAGLAPYADRIRPESKAVIQKLHGMGIKNTVMLTGDNAAVAKSVSRSLGLSGYFADMLPADKASAIQELQREGKIVVMVGDGINDSPALSFADVGVAMKHGAEIAHESAHVVLMEDSLWKLVRALDISKDAVNLIRQNYAIVSALNSVALALALPGGLISPSVTALISNGAAVAASLNGMRPILRYQ